MKATDARMLIELHNSAVHSLDEAVSRFAQDDSAAAASSLQSAFGNVLKAIVVIAERFDREDSEKSKYSLPRVALER